MFITQEKKKNVQEKNATDSVPLKARSTKMHICKNITIAPTGLFWGKIEIICSVSVSYQQRKFKRSEAK